MLRSRRALRTFTGLLFLIQVASGLCQNPPESSDIDKKASDIIQAVSDHLVKANTIQLNVNADLHVTTRGMKQEMTNRFDVSVERPNKLAILQRDGMMGMTAVSDGTSLSLHNTLTNAYQVVEAPDKLEEAKETMRPYASSAPGLALISGSMWGSNPYETIMDGVTSGVYVARTHIDGRPVHHLRFTQEAFDWDAWVSAEEPPVLKQVTLNMTRQLESASERMSELAGMEMSVDVKFQDWKFNEAIPSDVFEFSPPAGATLTTGDEDDDNQVSELLGEEAPDFDLPLLGGGNAKLADMTSTVVVLDFWASWCGPCRDGLPIVAKVAQKFTDRPVKFIAVNLMEDVDTIEKFLRDEKIEIAVAMDKEGEVAGAYGAEAIPTTVIIGPDKRIQAVHIGLPNELEKTLTDEIEAVLQGEDLAAKAPKSRKEPTDDETGSTTSALVPTWTLPGRWTSVAFDDASSRILALKQGTVATISMDGEIVSSTAIESQNLQLRLAKVSASESPNWVTFTRWGGDVEVFSTTGSKLWTYPRGNGVDDIWTGNISDDDADEIIIGYNGSTGLHAVDSLGKELWKYTRIGNAWHVCTGDLNGDGVEEVISTSAAGKVHVFDSTGNKLTDINTNSYAAMVRFAPGPDEPRVVVSGSDRKGEQLSAHSLDGTEKWATVLSDQRTHVVSGSVSSDGSHIAIGTGGGDVFVVRGNNGQIVAQLASKGRNPEVCWATGNRDGSPVLLVTSSNSLEAYTIDETVMRTSGGLKRITTSQFISMVKGKSIREVRDQLGKPYSYAPGDEYSLYYSTPILGMEIYDPDMDDLPASIQIMFQGGKATIVYFGE